MKKRVIQGQETAAMAIVTLVQEIAMAILALEISMVVMITQA